MSITFKEYKSMVWRNTKEALKMAPSIASYSILSLFMLVTWSEGLDFIFKKTGLDEKLHGKQRRYEMLNQQAIGYANIDTTKGLSLKELSDLYERAGIEVTVRDPRAINITNPKVEDLERAIESYEAERK